MLGPGARVSFDGQALRILLASRDESERAEIEACRLLDGGDYGFTLWLAHRSDAEGRWEPVDLLPGLATETGEEAGPVAAGVDAEDGELAFADEPPDGSVGWDEARYEVVLSVPPGESARALRDRLQVLGIPAAVSRDRIRVPARDAGAAAELSEWLWSEAPAGTKVSIRRVSLWRRLGRG